MKARKLIEGAVFDAPTVAVIGEAFDRAWSEIAAQFTSDGDHVERARIRLAHAILAVADEKSRDPERLKRHALEVLALTYGGKITAGGQRKPSRS